jgi:hypothetical protein
MTTEQYQELMARIESMDDEGQKFRKMGLRDLLRRIDNQVCYQRDYFRYELETVDSKGNRLTRER